MQRRDHGIDAVRLLSIAAIVGGHVWTGTTVDTWLYTWHVPVFFFLTGYLWKPRRSMRDEVSRRAGSLLKPYAFWFAITVTVFVTASATTGQPFIGSTARAIYGGEAASQPFTTFWFIGVLFGASLAWRALGHTPAAVRAGVAVAALACWAPLGQPLAATPLSVGTIIPAVGLIAAGSAAAWLDDKYRHSYAISGAAVVLAVAFIAVGMSSPVEMKDGDAGTPMLSAASAIAISWGLVNLGRAASLPARVGEQVTKVAGLVVPVVLAHPLVLWLAKDAALPSPLLFILACGLPLAVAYAASFTPAAEWVTGVRSPRERAHTSPQNAGGAASGDFIADRSVPVGTGRP